MCLLVIALLDYALNSEFGDVLVAPLLAITVYYTVSILE